MTGQLSRGPARWKYNTGEDAGYLQLDEKTPEALLQLGIEHVVKLRRISGRLWSKDFGSCGVDSAIPLSFMACSNLYGKNVWGQYLVGSFAGAAPSQKVTEGFIKVS